MSRPGISSDVRVPRLRDHRLNRAMSQDELASKSGVSRSRIIKLEAGGQAWPKTVGKLARALRVSVADLREEHP